MKVLVLLALIGVALAKHEMYQGWKSFTIGPHTKEHFSALQETSELLELDFLGHPSETREGLVLVKPEKLEGFLKLVNKLHIPYKIHSDDVKSALEKDDQEIASRRLLRGNRNVPYDDYQRFDVINNYLVDIAKRYPDKVKLVDAATTPEGRAIKYLKISTTNFEDIRKPVIVIDGGIHAREWITPPVVTWAIHKLVEDVTEPDLLDRFDWILLPVVNPDGYEYTHTSYRFWRKTRSINSSSPSCPGVDGNRNYDIFWNSVGTSNNPCDDIYAGPRAFSEIETRVVRDILQENLSRIPLYLTMHSYGSYILYPWGHDGSLSQNGLALHTVGIAMANAIDAKKLPNFPNYIVGNSMLTLYYAAAGASEDYAHSLGIPLAYTIELPGLGFGLNAFHLEPKYIQQVAHETWEGIVVGARRAGDLFKN